MQAGTFMCVLFKEAKKNLNGNFFDNVASIAEIDAINNLGAGNRTIFLDVYWQLLAYEEGGIKEITELHDNKKIDDKMFRGFEMIEKAKGAKNKEEAHKLIYDGNALIAEYEQTTVLQGVFDNMSILDRANVNLGGDLVRSPIPGSKSTFKGFSPKGTFTDTADRWKWVNDEMLPEWDKYLAANTAEHLDADLARQYKTLEQMALELGKKK
jgi:hypothetical protein